MLIAGTLPAIAQGNMPEGMCGKGNCRNWFYGEGMYYVPGQYLPWTAYRERDMPQAGHCRMYEWSRGKYYPPRVVIAPECREGLR